MRRVASLALALILAGCAGTSGVPVTGFANKAVESAYIPLKGSFYLLLHADAAAVSLGGGIAVTNAHNANLVDPKDVIGISADYDLLFFHTAKTASIPAGTPKIGEYVTAYGQGEDGGLRKAWGRVTTLDAPVKARCAACKIQAAFTFDGNAGPGFSGGPVIDAYDGRLVGILFGYVEEEGGKRLIYVYPIARVEAELSRIEGKLPMDVD